MEDNMVFSIRVCSYMSSCVSVQNVFVQADKVISSYRAKVCGKVSSKIVFSYKVRDCIRHTLIWIVCCCSHSQRQPVAVRGHAYNGKYSRWVKGIQLLYICFHLRSFRLICSAEAIVAVANFQPLSHQILFQLLLTQNISVSLEKQHILIALRSRIKVICYFFFFLVCMFQTKNETKIEITRFPCSKSLCECVNEKYKYL